MKRGNSLRRLALLAAALLGLATCIASCGPGADNPIEARSGRWRGETAFGSFSFTVCEGGRRIEGYRLEYTIGGVTQALASGGGDDVSVDNEGAFELSAPDAGVTFRGQFSADGKSASGVWEIRMPGGDTLSEDWTVAR